MANLITVDEFATFRKISKKQDSKKIEEAIRQAQQSDLISILGDFYFDVLKYAGVAGWLPLMNGSEFTYNNEDFEHAGIKSLLADYAYARYIYTKPINDTSFGIVIKESQDSSPADRNILKDMQKQAQVDAGVKFKFIEKYILSEPLLFSRYCKNKDKNLSFASRKFYKLR